MKNYGEDDQCYQDADKALEIMQKAIQMEDKLLFYGAGLRSEEILQMQEEGFGFLRTPDAFIVSDGRGCRESLNGIPVYQLDGNEGFIEDACIVVIAMDIYHEEIKKKLAGLRYKSLFFLTDDMEHLLTREFLRHYLQQHGLVADFLPFVRENHVKREMYEGLVQTYRVMCLSDVKLTHNVEQHGWIASLQVGAALTNERIAELCDNTGDHISEKNPYYNELTGLYWVWKNTDAPYSGICHYRRQFESDIALAPIIDNTADVVLPLPFVVGNSLAEYYLHWGEKTYYMQMIAVIQEKFPDYFECANWCKTHIMFIPNNICIARREILNDYCNFLFGVIDEVEKRMECYAGKKQTRCWLSEHVSTIYFVRHLKDYRIAFANLKRYW